MQKDKLIIFDTTMRDGEQSPGAAMTREEKVRIGRQLERMHVDVIEAGFPAASDGDFESRWWESIYIKVVYINNYLTIFVNFIGSDFLATISKYLRTRVCRKSRI